ncbi:Uncharacterised protein [Yersinia enterocolitica]|nr:Uncharacterised protein [Yersinia enterocolitica]
MVSAGWKSVILLALLMVQKIRKEKAGQKLLSLLRAKRMPVAVMY